MKSTILILLALLVFISSCQPNPTISGKKLSEWNELLEDKDNATVELALNAISKLEQEEAERSKKPLKKLASSTAPAHLRVFACTLLWAKYEIPPACSGIDAAKALFKLTDWNYDIQEMLSENPKIADEACQFITDQALSEEASSSATELWQLTFPSIGKPAIPHLERIASSSKDEFEREMADIILKTIQEELDEKKKAHKK